MPTSNSCGPGTTLSAGKCVPSGDTAAADGSSPAADAAAPGDTDTAPADTTDVVLADSTDAVPAETVDDAPDAAPADDATATADVDAGPCVPNCADKECGSNGCGGSCGTCAFQVGKPTCSDQGKCVAYQCKPACEGLQCGPDGCGGTCGTCGAGTICVSGQCDALDAGASCKGNCGKVAPSGCSCLAGCTGAACCQDFAKACTCQPKCKGLQCGDDGCGGKCGTCAAGSVCKSWTCVDDPCDPDPCNGHGKCIAGGACDCKDTYAGAKCGACAPGYVNYPACTKDPCAGQTCSGKGTCQPKDGSCKCDPGFGSPDCGTCLYWAHKWPDCKADPCAGNNCNGKGECLAAGGGCACQPGFVGELCGKCWNEKDIFPKCGIPVSPLGVDPNVAAITCAFCGVPLAKVATAADAGDTTVPAILAVFPADGATVTAGLPFTVVISDKVDPNSFKSTTVKLAPIGASQVTFATSVVVHAVANGATAVMVSPAGVSYTGPVRLTLDGILDDGGKALPKWSTTADYVFAPGASGFGGNLGFESGNTGCTLFGDASASPGSGNMQPAQGNKHLVLTTFDAPKVGKEGAIAKKVSWVTCGPLYVPAGKNQVQFTYDFASDEFDEVPGKGFGAHALVAITTPAGSAGGVLSGTALVPKGLPATSAYGLPGFADDDGIARHTGDKVVKVSGVGAAGPQLFLTFMIADSPGQTGASVLTVDAIKFE